MHQSVLNVFSNWRRKVWSTCLQFNSLFGDRQIKKRGRVGTRNSHILRTVNVLARGVKSGTGHAISDYQGESAVPFAAKVMTDLTAAVVRFFEFTKSVIIFLSSFLPTEVVLGIFEVVMGINPLRCNLCKITDIVFFLTRHSREISFFHCTTANPSTPTLTHFPSHFG